MNSARRATASAASLRRPSVTPTSAPSPDCAAMKPRVESAAALNACSERRTSAIVCATSRPAGSICASSRATAARTSFAAPFSSSSVRRMAGSAARASRAAPVFRHWSTVPRTSTSAIWRRVCETSAFSSSVSPLKSTRLIFDRISEALAWNADIAEGSAGTTTRPLSGAGFSAGNSLGSTTSSST